MRSVMAQRMLVVVGGVPSYIGELLLLPEVCSASTFQLVFAQGSGYYDRRYLLFAGRGLPESSGLAD